MAEGTDWRKDEEEWESAEEFVDEKRRLEERQNTEADDNKTVIMSSPKMEETMKNMRHAACDQGSRLGLLDTRVMKMESQQKTGSQEMGELKEEFALIKRRLLQLEREVKEYKKDGDLVENREERMKRRGDWINRNNIIILNLSERGGAAIHDVETTIRVKIMLRQMLGRDAEIMGVIRMGMQTEGNIRPVLVKCSNFRMRQEILAKKGCLKIMPPYELVRMDEDICRDVRRIRQRLKLIKKNIKEIFGLHAKLVYDELVIVGTDDL